VGNARGKADRPGRERGASRIPALGTETCRLSLMSGRKRRAYCPAPWTSGRWCSWLRDFVTSEPLLSLARIRVTRAEVRAGAAAKSSGRTARTLAEDR